jgi:nucleoid-associated protein YgaU
MTRETKIGLLVGLAFIIVIGILLSDHLSSTNEPLGAPLRVAGDTLRSGLGQPASDDVAPVLRAPQAIVPQQSVVTNEELNQHTAQQNGQPPVRFVAPPVAQAITPDPGVVNTPLRDIARQHGEDLIPVQNNTVVSNTTPPKEPPVTRTAARTYVAEAGDSLSTMAQKAYGSGCRANREAIVAANASLIANRDLIIVGHTYNIPSLDKAAPTEAAEKPALAKEKDTTYVVKPHDTLWSIAMSEVGTPSAVATIKELNQDVLNGSDRVRPNMKLILPTRKTTE